MQFSMNIVCSTYTVVSTCLPPELEGSAGGGGRRERLHSVTAGGEPGAGDGVVQRRKKKKKKKKKNTKLQRQSTLIRSEVERLPSFWPVFIILVTIAEVCCSLIIHVHCTLYIYITGVSVVLAPITPHWKVL